MSYVDKDYYKSIGFDVPTDMKFERLESIASDLIYDVCVIKPDAVIEAMEDFKKAVCYEVEMLYEQGGLDAVVGFSEASQRGRTERLGSYSISGSSSNPESVMTCNGIPVSSLSLSLLRKIGLMQRWAYLKASDLYAE